MKDRQIPEWLKAEIDEIKSQEYWEIKQEREEREEQEELTNWINQGGY